MKTQNTNLRLNQDNWKRIISEQEASGKSVSAYCRDRGINGKTFYNWRKKLGSRQETKPEGFIQIKATENRSGKVLRIQTPGGYHLEVEPGTEKNYVQSILAILAGLR